MTYPMITKTMAALAAMESSFSRFTDYDSNNHNRRCRHDDIDEARIKNVSLWIHPPFIGVYVDGMLVMKYHTGSGNMEWLAHSIALTGHVAEMADVLHQRFLAWEIENQNHEAKKDASAHKVAFDARWGTTTAQQEAAE